MKVKNGAHLPAGVLNFILFFISLICDKVSQLKISGFSGETLLLVVSHQEYGTTEKTVLPVRLKERLGALRGGQRNPFGLQGIQPLPFIGTARHRICSVATTLYTVFHEYFHSSK